MKILVACEYSGRVRDAFAARGHYAASCDLLPTEAPGRHYAGDVLHLLYPELRRYVLGEIGYEYAREGVMLRYSVRVRCALQKSLDEARLYPCVLSEEDRELLAVEAWDMVIGHPECTYLTISANRWLKDQPARANGTLVGAARRAAREAAIDFFMALVEAPVAKHCLENPKGVMSTVYQKPTQIVQPWQHGHGEVKGHCLWLKGLPPLVPTEVVEGREPKIHFAGPGKTPDARRKARSLTFLGIARAMAFQWG